MFADLHRRLWALEEKLSASRDFYNGCARQWNQLVQGFPSSLVAKVSGARDAALLRRVTVTVVGVGACRSIPGYPWRSMRWSQASVFALLGVFSACKSPTALWSAQGSPAAAPRVASSVAAAARDAIASLDEPQRAKACFEFAHAERINWQFVPGQYPGVALADLGLVQKRAMHRLLQSVLSTEGYHKTTAIMRLEDTLREYAQAAGRTREVATRDPGRYAVAFFGKPSSGADATPWGFRLQGHHISWNFTSIDPRVVAVPMFLGTNPAEVREGHHAGFRVLAAEEDLARALLASLSDQQRGAAVLGHTAPKDVFWGPGKLREVVGDPTRSDLLRAAGVAARVVVAIGRNLCAQLATRSRGPAPTEDRGGWPGRDSIRMDGLEQEG